MSLCRRVGGHSKSRACRGRTPHCFSLAEKIGHGKTIKFDRLGRPQERRWTARRQSQQAAPDRWPAHYRLPCKMAFGAGQPQRCTDAPACLCCQGADAVHAPVGLIYMPPTEAPARGFSHCARHSPCQSVWPLVLPLRRNWRRGTGQISTAKRKKARHAT